MICRVWNPFFFHTDEEDSVLTGSDTPKFTIYEMQKYSFFSMNSISNYVYKHFSTLAFRSLSAHISCLQQEIGFNLIPERGWGKAPVTSGTFFQRTEVNAEHFGSNIFN